MILQVKGLKKGQSHVKSAGALFWDGVAATFWLGFLWPPNKGRQNCLVVSTHLKNISQIGNLPQIEVKKKTCLKPPPRKDVSKVTVWITWVQLYWKTKNRSTLRLRLDGVWLSPKETSLRYCIGHRSHHGYTELPPWTMISGFCGVFCSESRASKVMPKHLRGQELCWSDVDNCFFPLWQIKIWWTQIYQK